MLNKALRNCLVDCSTDTELFFTACCEECGKGHFGLRKKFSKAGIRPTSDEQMTVYRILYKREWEQVKEEMVQSLREHFNICPMCRRMVCDDCFLICDELDMCKSCADILKEKAVAES